MKMAAIDADKFFRCVRSDFKEFLVKNRTLSRGAPLDDLRRIAARLEATRDEAVSADDLGLSWDLSQLALGLFLVHFGALKAECGESVPSGSVH